MTDATRAPNRVLDLSELELPEFREPVRVMEAMNAREAISYLHPSKRWEYPWALGRAQLRAGDRVLDAGCGASIFPVYLASLGARVSACDLQVPAGLDRLHGRKVDYVRADLTRLPFAAGEFDAVFCVSVIEHLSPGGVRHALAELGRVLRPKGRLLLTTDFCRDAGAEMWYSGPGGPFRVDWSVFDEGGLRRHILAAEGFRVEGEVDLRVDWDAASAAMEIFHGYPYTAVGVCLVRTTGTCTPQSPLIS